MIGDWYLILAGERPYKCHIPECGRAFIQLSNLQQHLRNHESQIERLKNRPFHCNICGKGFATESSLRTHTGKVSLRTDNPAGQEMGDCSKGGNIRINIKTLVTSNCQSWIRFILLNFLAAVTPALTEAPYLTLKSLWNFNNFSTQALINSKINWDLFTTKLKKLNLCMWIRYFSFLTDIFICLEDTINYFKLNQKFKFLKKGPVTHC